MKQCPNCGEWTDGRNRCTECGIDFERNHKDKKKDNPKHKDRRRKPEWNDSGEYE